MKFKIIALVTSLALSLFISPATAVASSLTMNLRQTPSASEVLVTLYGSLRPTKSGTTVSIQVDTAGKWTTTRFSTKVSKVGTWRVTALATALEAKVRYRAVAVVSGKSIYSPIRGIEIKQLPEISNVDPALFIDLLGLAVVFTVQI